MPSTQACKHAKPANMQARKHVSTQARQSCEHVNPQTRKTRKHASTSSTQFSRLVLSTLTIFFVRCWSNEVHFWCSFLWHICLAPFFHFEELLIFLFGLSLNTNLHEKSYQRVLCNFLRRYRSSLSIIVSLCAISSKQLIQINVCCT